MEPPRASAWQVVEASKRLVRRLLTIGENRFELLMVEAQEERERLLQAIRLALAVAVFGLLAGVALTGAVVVSAGHQRRPVGRLNLGGVPREDRTKAGSTQK